MSINFTPTTETYWLLPAPSPLPYVSLHATNRVRDPLPKPTICPYCGGNVKLVNNREIYGKSIGDWPFAYSCQKCGEAYTGVHPDTDIPVGHLADKKLRQARQAAKQSFHDMLEQQSTMTRQGAYLWLSKQLGLPISQTHYGWFNYDWCQKAHSATKQEIAKCQNNR